jgi:hypothetical protein
MNQTEHMRKILNLLTESVNGQAIDTEAAQDLLAKISPTFNQTRSVDEAMSPVIGGMIAFVSVFIGDTEIANVGPLDYNGAKQMQSSITRDLERAYTNSHPNGFTDGSGAIFRLSDWDVNIETCHSDECADVINPRMDAIRARAAKRQ